MNLLKDSSSLGYTETARHDNKWINRGAAKKYSGSPQPNGSCLLLVLSHKTWSRCGAGRRRIVMLLRRYARSMAWYLSRGTIIMTNVTFGQHCCETHHTNRMRRWPFYLCIYTLCAAASRKMMSREIRKALTYSYVYIKHKACMFYILRLCVINQLRLMDCREAWLAVQDGFSRSLPAPRASTARMSIYKYE